MSAEEAVQYLHELVRSGLVSESRMDDTYFPFLSKKENMYTSFFPYKDCKNDAEKEDKEKEFSNPSEKEEKKEEKKKEDAYLPPAEAAAKLRELSVRLKMKKISAAGRVSPDESRERQKQAMRSIIAG